MTLLNALAIFGTIVGIINGAVSVYVILVVNRLNRSEDRLAKKSEDYIDSRFENMHGQCKLKHEVVSHEISAINKRLERGDNAFDAQGEGSHRIEIKLVAAIGELRREMLAECADRQAVEKLASQVAELNGRFGSIEEAIRSHQKGNHAR